MNLAPRITAVPMPMANGISSAHGSDRSVARNRVNDGPPEASPTNCRSERTASAMALIKVRYTPTISATVPPLTPGMTSATPMSRPRTKFTTVFFTLAR